MIDTRADLIIIESSPAFRLRVGSVNSSARQATTPTTLTTVRRNLSGEEISDMYDAVDERRVHDGRRR